MSKYLRHIEFRGFQSTPSECDSQVLPICSGWNSNAWNGIAMYRRYALPVPCEGLAKLNIFGCLSSEREPTEAVFGVAICWVKVETKPKTTTDLRMQQQFLLDTVHRAIIQSAPTYGFLLDNFINAYQRVMDEEFHYEFWIGKSFSSPNRKLKARVFFQYDNAAMTYLVISDSRGNEISRILFCHCHEQSLGRMKWTSNETIIIMRENNRDYWLCSIDGTVEFQYPQADSNDPHAIYRLATILLDGYGVIPNPSKGMELLERCAKMGYKHAIKRLQMPRHSTDPSDTGEPGILPPGNW